MRITPAAAAGGAGARSAARRAIEGSRVMTSAMALTCSHAATLNAALPAAQGRSGKRGDGFVRYPVIIVATSPLGPAVNPAAGIPARRRGR